MAKINITEKDTKDTIFKAYQAILKEKQSLEKDKAILQKEITNLQENTNSYNDNYNSTENTQSVDIVGIIENIQHIKGSITQALSALSVQQLQQVNNLEKINQDIAIEKAEAKELYNIDLTEQTLENIFNEYENTKNTFDESFATKKKNYHDLLAEKQNTWHKEQEEYSSKKAEKIRENDLARKRENDEFEYLKKQKRAALEDAANQLAKQRRDELQALNIASQETWAAREKELVEREKNFETYKEKFEVAESEILKEVKKAEAEGKGIIEREHKVKLNLFHAENNANQRSLDLKINALKSNITNQSAQISKLTAQLENALTQSQSLALKALEGSTNAESFAAIREIAIEQAKNSSKTK